MELYLDSANIDEIQDAFELGFLDGLTTTPTFMAREGITDIDGMLLKLAKIVPVLQVEALGNVAGDIFAEAERQIDLGLDKSKTVFKIPVSLEGVKACKMLRNRDYRVNVHLVYTLQQAYMALAAGANYVCPLVGRLQDQGQDALGLIRGCVETVEYYQYDAKIMFSSVRTIEHVKNALEVGAHTCTVPWNIIKKLTDNHFTTLGTNQFFADTKLMTRYVKDVMRTENPVIDQNRSIMEALVKMTQSKTGAVTVTDEEGKTVGVFTDGDFRRLLEKSGENVLHNKMKTLTFRQPISIHPDALLYDASKIFKEKKVDNICVQKEGKPVGMLDVQDLI
ncbi:MAG: CBS domain-containing protein [SAR324 cluster bacterium]|nr:CBS domain-containing protein [SAR324 cluster bacterium]